MGGVLGAGAVRQMPQNFGQLRLNTAAKVGCVQSERPAASQSADSGTVLHIGNRIVGMGVLATSITETRAPSSLKSSAVVTQTPQKNGQLAANSGPTSGCWHKLTVTNSHSAPSFALAQYEAVVVASVAVAVVNVAVVVLVAVVKMLFLDVPVLVVVELELWKYGHSSRST
jgi:hypothetical protein